METNNCEKCIFCNRIFDFDRFVDCKLHGSLYEPKTCKDNNDISFIQHKEKNG